MMSVLRYTILAALALGLAACANSAPPSSFSNSVRTDSGLSATGAAGPQGGAGSPSPGAGSVGTTPVR
jgi:hypothetical protein